MEQAALVGRGVQAGSGVGVLNEIGVKEQDQGGVQLPAMELIIGAFEEAAEVKAEDVYHPDFPDRPDGAEGFLVGIGGMGGQDDHLSDPCALLPGGDKFVHDSVQCLPAERRRARAAFVTGGMDAELDGRCPGNAGPGGEIVGEPFEDQRVAAQRQVRAAEFEGTGRHDQPSGLSQPVTGVGRCHLFQAPRVGHLTPRRTVWLLAVVVLALAAGEWLRAPGPWPVVFTSGAAVAIAGMAILGRDLDGARWSSLVTAWLAAALSLALGATEVHRASLQRDWSVEESRLATRAEQQTLRALSALGDRLTHLAGEATGLGALPPERAFDAMSALIPRTGPDIALALFDASGRPEVWAGTHRLPLVPLADSVVLRRSAFYAVLEVRRHRPGGGTALGTGLLRADAAVPARPASLAGSIADDLGVGVGFEPAGAPGAPGARWPAVGPVLRVTLDPRAPGEAVSALLDRAGLVVGLLLLGFVIAAAASAPQIPARYLVLALLSWLVVRAPLDEALGLEQPFSSASFSSPLFGFLSSSAGSLVIAGTLGLVVFVGAWRARFRRGALSTAAAALLLVATPYLVRELGRGIRPPAADVPLSLWLTWHLALLVTAAALLAAAAALQRAEPAGPRTWRFAGLGAAWGCGAAFLGVLAYTGSPAWPTWYTFLWFPAVLLATRPAPRLWTILAIGMVAGAGASLMTWGAAITGRTTVALRDVATLGTAPDAAAGPLLEDLSQQVALQPPGDAAALYRLWRGSALRLEAYPARLTIWSGGRILDDVVLDGLSVTDSTLAALAGSADSLGRHTVARQFLSPGAHYILSMRLDLARTLTVAIGPRSVLIPPAPLGRLLETGPARSTLYRLSLTPAAADRVTWGPGWRREGWALRSVRSVTLPGGPVDANVLIPIGRPGSIYVRGALLILVDVAIIWLFWLGAERTGRSGPGAAALAAVAGFVSGPARHGAGRVLRHAGRPAGGAEHSTTDR